MLEQLIAEYGYLAVLLGTFLEGETILVLAGFAAHQGYLDLPLVIACAFAGSLAGDQLWFFLGRRYGRGWLAARPKWQARTARVTALLERNSTLFILSFRFLYGLRNVSPVAIALSGVSALRFALLNAVAAGIWALAVGCAGYFFGEAVEAAFGDLHKWELRLLAGAALAALFLLLARLIHRRLVRRRGSPAA